MATADYGMVYDVSRFLADRKNHKKSINLEQFYGMTNAGQIFVLEYTAQTKAQEHIIIWARRPRSARYDPGCPTFSILDARIYDEMGDDTLIGNEPSLRPAMNNIKLEQIIAMRINQERYNWDLVSRVFMQE